MNMEENTTKIGQIKVNDLEVSVNLVNDKLHFQGKAGDKAVIDTDYTPPLGDNLGYMPLELFLISFATCAGGSILALLRRMKKTINGLDIKTSGIRREEHPTSFSKINLHIILKSEDTGIVTTQVVFQFGLRSAIGVQMAPLSGIITGMFLP